MADAVTGSVQSAVVSVYDVVRPEEWLQLMPKYGNDYLNAVQMMMSMGRERAVSDESFHHRELGWYQEPVQVRNAVVDPGAGASITFEVADNSVDNGRIYIRKNHQIRFNNRATGVVMTDPTESGGVWSVTVVPDDTTKTLGALAQDEYLSIIGSVHSEGSGQPKGQVTKIFKFTNNLSTIKTTARVTGHQLATNMWQTSMEGGGALGGYFDVALMQASIIASKHASAHLLTSTKSNNTGRIDPDTNEPINTTQGMFPYAEQYALPYPKAIGSLATADFTAFDNYLTTQGLSHGDVMVACGKARRNEIRDLMVTYFQGKTEPEYVIQGVYDRAWGNMDVNARKALMAQVDFSCLQWGDSRRFCFKTWHELMDPETFGHGSSTLTNEALLIPLGRAKGVGTALNPYFSLVYRSHNGYNRRMTMWRNGATGAPGSQVMEGDLDVENWYYRQHIGFEGYKGNQWIHLKAA